MKSASLKRATAGASLAFAVVGLVISLSSFSPASADISGSNSTGSSVGTVPQCAWHLQGVSGSVSLTHGSSDLYNGASYALSGTTSSVNTFVAASDATSPTTDPTACSWYGTTNGAQVTVSTTGTPAFSSTSFSGDSSMNFALTSGNPLAATLTPSCGSTWATAASGANNIYSGQLSGVPASLSKTNTTTDSSCSYSITYSTNVPSGLVPAHAGQIYAMTGPSLTTTLALTN